MKNRSFPILALVASLAALPALASASSGLVQGDPQLLVVQPEDLPGELALREGDAGEGSYLALYVRPQALTTTGEPGEILGALTGVEILDGTPAASQSFAEGQAAAAVGAPVLEGAQRIVDTRRLPIALAGTEEALLFRVEYDLGDVRVVDYRYRLRVANAVAHLTLSVRAASGVEPASFADQARDVAAAQVARLSAGLQE